MLRKRERTTQKKKKGDDDDSKKKTKDAKDDKETKKKEGERDRRRSRPIDKKGDDDDTKKKKGDKDDDDSKKKKSDKGEESKKKKDGDSKKDKDKDRDKDKDKDEKKKEKERERTSSKEKKPTSKSEEDKAEGNLSQSQDPKDQDAKSEEVPGKPGLKIRTDANDDLEMLSVEELRRLGCEFPPRTYFVESHDKEYVPTPAELAYCRQIDLLEIENYRGQTPVVECVFYGRKFIFDDLIRAGCDINQGSERVIETLTGFTTLRKQFYLNSIGGDENHRRLNNLQLSVVDWQYDQKYSQIMHKIEREIGLLYGYGGVSLNNVVETYREPEDLASKTLIDPEDLILNGKSYAQNMKEEAERIAEEERLAKLAAEGEQDLFANLDLSRFAVADEPVSPKSRKRENKKKKRPAAKK